MKNPTKKTVLAFLSTVLLLASCRKDDDVSPGRYTHYTVVDSAHSAQWDHSTNGQHATPGWQSVACHGDTCAVVAYTGWMMRFEVTPVTDTVFTVSGLQYNLVQTPYDFTVDTETGVRLAHLEGSVGDTLWQFPVVVSFPSP